MHKMQESCCWTAFPQGAGPKQMLLDHQLLGHEPESWQRGALRSLVNSVARSPVVRIAAFAAQEAVEAPCGRSLKVSVSAPWHRSEQLQSAAGLSFLCSYKCMWVLLRPATAAV